MNIGLFGSFGEKKALSLLRRKGYKIIDTNFQTRFGEIDIIAENAEYIIFAEVKSRGEKSIAEPREFVTNAKKRKIIKSAEIFLSLFPSQKQPRFDVVEVKKEGMKISVCHTENAFEVE